MQDNGIVSVMFEISPLEIFKFRKNYSVHICQFQGNASQTQEAVIGISRGFQIRISHFINV